MGTGFRSPAKIARRLRILPLAIQHVENWAAFVFHYALGLTPDCPYRFRSGASIRIERALDHVPLIEIFLRRDYGRVADGAVILDLGANIGAFSIYAASTARGVQVYAYEPLPSFFALMERNIRENRQENAVRCFNLAVAADGQNRHLQMPGAGVFFPRLVRANEIATAPAQLRSVPCTSLADILRANALSRVDLLKMDCEGSEYDILYSAAPDVLSRIVELRIEYHKLDGPEENVASLKKFLHGAGYTVNREEAVSGTNGNLWARRCT